MSHRALRKRPLDLAIHPVLVPSQPARRLRMVDQSPELNVLVFSIWVMLEQEASRKCLEKPWNEIPQDHARAAVEAYPRRLMAVIRVKGGHIE
ncbi:hypothetical protein ANCDUO_10180 [Ancylostoma duodenale]|uniref:Uncharacterized protein n=1 Tax=Ancylostoma duodenale TaxID=51022 RepID=A0A0C2GRG3_9BILA|nr:hypothetical protein ANCDUO_10180 [Ancylostoma duodenale]